MSISDNKAAGSAVQGAGRMDGAVANAAAGTGTQAAIHTSGREAGRELNAYRSDKKLGSTSERTGPTLSAMIGRAAEVELRKILAQFKYRALPVLIALVPLAVLLLNGAEGGVVRFSSVNLPYTLLSLAAYVLLPLVACMLAADLFAGERERGELKIPLTRPVSRPALAVGKITAMLAYQGGLLLLLLVLSLVTVFFSGAGLGDLNLPGIIGAYVLTLLPAAAISAGAAFASTLARSATSGFVLGAVLIAAMNVTGLLFPAVAPILPTEYMALYKTLIGSGIAYAQLGLGAGILIGCMTILTAAQILLFDRKEV